MKTFFINMLLLFTATLSFAQVPNYVPTNGLVGWWPFSGNAIDSSGNGNNGTVNGATLTTDRNGNVGKAYSFDGVDDFITSNTNGIPSTGNISVSVWAYFYQNNGIAEYLCLGSGGSTSWGALAGTNWNGSPYLALNYGRGCAGSGISNVAVSPLLNSWQHIVYVSTGVGGVCNVYLNGNYVGQSNNGSTGGCSNANLYFGVDIFSSPDYINCKLDDIGIWNRVLSQQEITNLYTSSLPAATCLPNYVPTTGLVGWWPFCGNANDESGNGNNGTVNGATLTTDRNGLVNKAYSFDGINDNINPLQNNLPASNTSRSVSIWFQRIGSGGCLFSYGTASTGNAYMISLGSNIIANQGWTSPDFPVFPSVDNNWHNVICTFDGTISKIYFDGILQGTGNMSGLNTILSSFYFGTRVLNDQDFFNGKIDDIGIWNRVLTQQEITDLYNSCQLSVINQPISQVANLNSNVQFVLGSTAPNATYQWQTDLGFGFVNLNNGGQYSGANNDTLIISNVGNNNNNQTFRCIVIDGSCTDTSDIAILTVCTGISVQPQNQNAIVGNNVLFISSTNASTATYQWQTDLGFGFVNLSNSGQYSGVTNDSLTVSNLSLTNNNQTFRCIVSAGLCTDTSNVALLTVTSSTNIIELNNNNIKIYPNPVTSQTRLDLQLNQAQDFEIAVYNNLGQSIFSKNYSNTKELNENIDMRQWPAGQYFVEIKLAEGTEIKKLIKE